jgi:hypothetical protein
MAVLGRIVRAGVGAFESHTLRLCGQVGLANPWGRLPHVLGKEPDRHPEP